MPPTTSSLALGALRPYARAPSVLAVRRILTRASAVALLTSWAVVALFAASGARAADEPIEVRLQDLDGDTVGTVTLRELPGGGVHLDAMPEALPPGVHGFHLHAAGTCDTSDGFKSAGGHLAGGRAHGFLVEGGPHPGDMSNIHVPDSGALHVEVVNTLVALGDAADGQDGPTALLDADGSALMTHSGADDYASQPSGEAGDRIACAEIVAGA